MDRLRIHVNEWLVVSWIFFFYFMDWTASGIRTPHFVIIYLHTYIPNHSSIFLLNFSQWFIIEVWLVFKTSIQYGMDNKIQHGMDNKYNMDRLAFSLVVGI